MVIVYYHLKYPELRWDWDNISTEKMSFPPSFIWGTATSAHQVEGNCINNWSEFEKGSKDDGQPNIKDSQQSGIVFNICFKFINTQYIVCFHLKCYFPYLFANNHKCQ